MQSYGTNPVLTEQFNQNAFNAFCTDRKSELPLSCVDYKTYDQENNWRSDDPVDEE